LKWGPVGPGSDVASKRGFFASLFEYTEKLKKVFLLHRQNGFEREKTTENKDELG
jgi:hypothetical protein